MHMSLNGKEHMYLDVHGYSCCSDISNAVSWE
jgi:hypothetical protein